MQTPPNTFGPLHSRRQSSSHSGWQPLPGTSPTMLRAASLASQVQALSSAMKHKGGFGQCSEAQGWFLQGSAVKQNDGFAEQHSEAQGWF